MPRPTTRDLMFGAVGLGLLLAYGLITSQLIGAFGVWPARAPAPYERYVVPRVPGAIAFVMRGYVYVLRDGRYAALTSDGRASDPHLSPDGLTLYFVRRESIDGARTVEGRPANARLGYSSVLRKPSADGPEELLIDGLRRRSPDGGHAVSWYLGPAVSRNGRSLAVIEDDGAGAADLAIARLEASAQRTLRYLSDGAELADPSWSPDGSMVAVTSYEAGSQRIVVWWVDPPVKAVALEGLPEGEPYRPSFSEDGARLVYTLRQNGRNDIHLFDLTSRRDVALTSDGKSWSGVLSPDGRWVAFLRERAGVIDVYALQLGGDAAAEPIKLTAGEGVSGADRLSWAR